MYVYLFYGEVIKLTKIAVKAIKGIASFLLGERWNSTMTESVKECGRLFGSAKDSIRIVTGELQHDLFENDQILSTLEELGTREGKSVNIEILHGPNPDPQSKRIFELPQKTKGRVHIMRVPKRPKIHFVLVDGTKFRLERFHGANKPERMAYMKTKPSIFLSNILAEKFADLKAVSRASEE